jgi:ATP-dependent Clp protease protease subunit
VTDIEIQAKEFLRLRTKLTEILMNHTGQPEDVIERDTERDFWMSSEDAVQYGLVDEVLEAQPKEDEEEDK